MNPFVIEHSLDELRLTDEFQRHMRALSAITLKSFSASRAGKEPEAKKGFRLDLKHYARHCGVSGVNACFDVSLTIDALADGDPRKPLFHVDCVFELVCELDEQFTPTEEHLIAFQRGNAVFVCWPYMREFVQNAISRLGLSVPPIPLLRVVRKRETVEGPPGGVRESKRPKQMRRGAVKTRS